MSFRKTVETRSPGSEPPFLGVRFDAEGRALRCSGNTVLSHLSDGAAKDAITALCDRLAAEEAGSCWAWLPPSSYHMTVYDGLLHTRRGPGTWPDKLTADASRDEADRFMAGRVARVPVPEGAFRVRIDGIGGYASGGLGLRLAPVDAAEERRIRGYRDALAKAAGLTGRPGHETYAFHMTLAYLIAWPEPGAADAFERAAETAAAALAATHPELPLGPADYCVFEDMTLFEPVHLID